MSQDLIFKTQDHPEANGRTPQPGEVGHPIAFPLDDGRTLTLMVGAKGMGFLFDLLQAHALSNTGHAPGGENGECPDCYGTAWHMEAGEWKCDVCHWSPQIPTYEGAWELACDEVPEATPVNIYLKGGVMWCFCRDVGARPLIELHHGLTNPRWRAANS